MTKDDLNSLAWPALRYALTRKTFVVDAVCRALIRNVKNIRSDIRYRMGEEIEKALNADEEKEMDHFLWGKVLKAFEEANQ